METEKHHTAKRGSERLFAPTWTLIIGGLVLTAVSIALGVLWSFLALKPVSSQQAQVNATPVPAVANVARELEPGSIPGIETTDWVEGNAQASVVLIEYSDLECPFCKRFHDTRKELVSEYGDRVAFVFRHLPLPSHLYAKDEAEAASCVGELAGGQAFYGFIDRVFARTVSSGTSFTAAQLSAMASEVGVSKDALARCVDGNQTLGLVENHLQQAQSAGLTSTPSIVVINTKDGTTTLIRGAQPIAAFRATLDKNLKD
jgi:protein-disulfide isomerase